MIKCQWLRNNGDRAIYLAYHAGATTDDERLLVCFLVITERGMEGGLETSVSECSG